MPQTVLHIVSVVFLRGVFFQVAFLEFTNRLSTHFSIDELSIRLYFEVDESLEASILQVFVNVTSGGHYGPANVAGYTSAKTSQASLWHP